MKVLGLMSGTSLDGLDLVMVEFKGFPSRTQQVHWQILTAKTISYSSEWELKLKNSVKLSAKELLALHAEYGRFLAEICNEFIEETGMRPELISSHGHTVYHEPKLGFTTQIGDGNVIAAETGVNTAYDFRSMDVAQGGQGAPLVPIGDEYLFGEYEACLNLGGIANISYKKHGSRIAFDISPFNLLLNHFAQKEGQAFDNEGNIAKSGEFNQVLFNKLSELEFYQKTGPKSLDKETLMAEYLSVITPFEISNADILHTLCKHFAKEIAQNIYGKTLLATGGGAYNKFFINELKALSSAAIIIPDNKIIDFKEALIFALMGYLRLYELDNVLATATGGKRNICSGSLIIAPVG